MYLLNQRIIPFKNIVVKPTGLHRFSYQPGRILQPLKLTAKYKYKLFHLLSTQGVKPGYA